MKKFKDSYFAIVWPFYLIGIIMAVCIYFAPNPHNYMSFIFILIGPAYHLMIRFYKSPFQKTLEKMTILLDEAEKETNPVKREIKFCAAAKKNSNTCAALSMYGHEEDKNYWFGLARFYNELAKTHREELCDLISKNPNWKSTASLN